MRVLPLCIILVAVPFGGCVKVPLSEERHPIPTSSIVKRVKCDLLTNVVRKVNQDRARFGFLMEWGAKVNLNFAIDESSGVTPGVSFINPLSDPGTSFTFGVGANLNTQAVKTDSIDFFLSFSEVNDEFNKLAAKGQFDRYDHCNLEDGILLESELGLHETFDRALAPVGDDILYRSAYPRLAGSAPAVRYVQKLDRLFQKLTRSKLLRKVEEPANAPSQVNEGIRPMFEKRIREAEDKNDKERANALAELAADHADAKSYEERAKTLVENVAKPLAELSAGIIDASCVKTVNQNKATAIAQLANVSMARANIENAVVQSASTTTAAAAKTIAQDSSNSLASVKESYAGVEDDSRAIITTIKTCKNMPKVDEIPETFDPIAGFSETVNFNVTASGSLAPSWRLVRFSGPLGNLVSATRKRSHILTLTIGRPTMVAGGGAKPSRAMEDQELREILRDAFSQSRSFAQ